jgi:serine protease Do
VLHNWCAVLVSCTAILFATVISPDSNAQGLPDTIDRIRGSIVSVGTYQPTRRPPSLFVATGFVVGDGIHVITNSHALPRKLKLHLKEVLVVANNAGKSAYVAKVVATDPIHDVALLRFDGAPFPALRLGDSESVREGELYAFTGFPIGEVLGLRPVTHRGIISSITPIATPPLSSGSLDTAMIKALKNPYNVFQLDATAYPGNSGSPLYHTETGKVIGIINRVFVKRTKEAVLSDPSGITYAIPIDHARALLEEAGVRAD